MKKELLTGLAWGGGIVLLALAASFARDQGHIDQDSVLRIVIGMNGLMIAFYGNRAPKVVAPTACAQRIARVSGWAFVLSGLLYAALWAFAPIPVAIWLGTAAVATGMVVTLGYCLWARARLAAERRPRA
ncbi:ammonium transporter [Sphingosinicella terrae]|uniref:ammonium transporter n=1 Tax=Sphingosinicella terrae TaxID=2172047 RepID=UPI0025484BEC|nr:ammonium transporter [Sphingosinicella terrae]